MINGSQSKAYTFKDFNRMVKALDRHDDAGDECMINQLVYHSLIHCIYATMPVSLPVRKKVCPTVWSVPLYRGGSGSLAMIPGARVMQKPYV